MTDSRIVVVGTLPPPLGGTTVLFKSFVDYLRCEAASVVVCDMARAGILRVLAVSFLRRRTGLVLFNLSSARVRYLIAISVLATIFRKKFAVRGFGGGWDVAYEELGPFTRLLCRRAFSLASFMCFETKHQVSYFDSLGVESVVWLPNSRSVDFVAGSSAARSCRFIYLGRICREKGVKMLLEAILQTAGEIEVDFFGPVEQSFDFDSVPGARFCGEVPPEEVVQLLQNYKALVLPTSWKGEGYPGVVLEAFVAGIPVISSRWRAIPELFEGNLDFLFEVSSVDDLIAKMRSVDEGELDVAEVVRRQRIVLSGLDSRIWNEKLLTMCRTG